MLADLHEHTFAILAYKDSPYLEECVQSILNQTVSSKRIICTSTPSEYIRNIGRKYNIEVFENKETGRGISGDWNFAYKLVDTPYLTLAHQDDIYNSDYTSQLLRASKKNKDLTIGFTDYFELVNGNIIKASTLLRIKRIMLLPFWLSNNLKTNYLKKSVLLLGNPICCPSVWFNKKLIGDFTFSNEFKVNLDWDAWRKLSDYKGTFSFIPEAIVYHRVHDDAESTKTIKSSIRTNEDLIMLTRSLGPKLGKLVNTFYGLGLKTYKRVT